MKLKYSLNKTALYLAIEKGNYEMVKVLLTCNKIDIDIFNIQTEIFQ